MKTQSNGSSLSGRIRLCDFQVASDFSSSFTDQRCVLASKSK